MNALHDDSDGHDTRPARAAGTPGRVAGVASVIALIESFDAAHARQTATEAGRRCGLTRTAAKRHLLTLIDLGYVQTDGKFFWLTAAVLRLGHAYLESARLPRIAHPYLQRINMIAQGTAQVSILDLPHSIYIARDGSSRGMNTGCVIGERVPAQVTAPGLLLLALQPPELTERWLQTCELKSYTPHTITSKERICRELEHARKHRWAMSEQQMVLNYRGIAVPLTDSYGVLVGALNVSLPMGTETRDAAVQRVLGLLVDVAQEMRHVIS